MTRHVERIALSHAILHRRTDRRRFTSREIPAPHLDLIVRRAAQAGALLIPVIDSATRWLLTRAIDTAARRQANNPDYQTELATWSRNSFAAQDGVLPASGPPTPVWHDDTAMRAFPGDSLDNAPTGHGEQDGSQLLGLATCPLSQPLEITDTRATIRDQVLDSTAHPHLILRIGWTPTSAPPLPHSPVHRTEDTIGYLPRR